MSYDAQEALLNSVLDAAAAVAAAAAAAQNEQQQQQLHECAICGELKPTGLCCTGRPSHFICQECLNNFARSAYEAGTGAFERRIERRVDNVVIDVSDVGQLPCPFYPADCTCYELARSSVVRLLTDEDLLDLQASAERRVGVALFERERQRAEQLVEEAQQRMLPRDFVRQAVEHVLDLGVRMPCPGCGIQGIKDDNCMHMNCEGCSCRWCYCCGRQRGHGEGECSTCDTSSLFLENNRGWGRFSLEDETRGRGALLEFHRRRTTYLLRSVMEATPRAIWQDFLENGGRELFHGVPTPSREIVEEEIASAAPPLFGTTRERNLRWNDVLPVVEKLRDQLGDVDHREAPPQPQPDRHNVDETTELVNVILEQGGGGREAELLLNQIFGDGDFQQNTGAAACRRRRGSRFRFGRR